VGNQKFPLISLEGTDKEIGIQHGKLLRGRILKTIDFYKTIFPPHDQIVQAAQHFKQIIQKHNPKYIDEIEGIAEGADIDPFWIYAINSRTEILRNHQIDPNECTAVYFKPTSILAQNWDWAEEFENLSVLMKISKTDGHTILTVTEPGMIGKIGLNNKGLGVCLNILQSGSKLNGLPIHVLLRAVLDSKNIEEAKLLIEKNNLGKASNIIIGDYQGNCIDFEFSSKELSTIENNRPTMIHTNHFIKNPSLNVDLEKLASSFARYKKASEIVEDLDDYSVSSMRKILLDTSDEELPVCRKYIADEELGKVGSVCSIIMDLKNFEMHLTRGNPTYTPFETFSLK
jgi:isopenicillin-N N-acyltransferase-like protein